MTAIPVNKISREEVEKLAKLANLTLSDDEISKFPAQISEILALVSRLSEVDTKSVGPTSQVTKQPDVFRDDSIDPRRSLTQQQALSQAKNTYKGFFVVPKIFD